MHNSVNAWRSRNSSDRPVVLVFRTISNFRLQRYIAQQLTQRGRKVVLVYERGEDDTFAQASREAAKFGGIVISFESAIEASCPKANAWRPRLLLRQRLLSALVMGAREVKIGIFQDIYRR